MGAEGNGNGKLPHPRVGNTLHVVREEKHGVASCILGRLYMDGVFQWWTKETIPPVVSAGRYQLTPQTFAALGIELGGAKKGTELTWTQPATDAVQRWVIELVYHGGGYLEIYDDFPDRWP